jgi:coproporphyrinogen III oxidase
MGQSVQRAVLEYLLRLHNSICFELAAEEPLRSFEGNMAKQADRGASYPRVLTGGDVLEKAAVMFTHAYGAQLPAAASSNRPYLVGHSFEAISVSVVVHPRNPYVPSTHMNIRAFFVTIPGEELSWWFGGGYDLTPYYPFKEDVLHWHRTAYDACMPFGADLYERFKRNCDEYFRLEHRGETRGVGGLFLDDFSEGGFEHAFELIRSIGDHFVPAYLPILRRRKQTCYTERERQFQLYRRGRYVEFNLLYDRGTRYGLQSGRRIESVLVSLPPVVEWRYDWHPEPGSPEAKLSSDFLRPRDWLADF